MNYDRMIARDTNRINNEVNSIAYLWFVTRSRPRFSPCVLAALQASAFVEMTVERTGARDRCRLSNP